MTLGILGRKVGMTQVYTEAGRAVPVTVVEAGPCHVLQLRTKDRDGYEAVQLGFLDKPRRNANRSERGHVAPLASKRAKKLAASGVEPLAKAKCEPKRFVREIRGSVAGVSVGDLIRVTNLESVKRVDVTGITIGRGMQGVMGRHGFKGQRATHGVKKVHRCGGSYGCRTFPGRVFKGKRMAGHAGASQATNRNLEIFKIDPDNNLILIRGAVPGADGGLVVIRETNKKKRVGTGKAPTSKKKKA